jgi:hypothetical protein
MKLFREQKISAHLLGVEKKIQDQIDGYSDEKLVQIEGDKTILGLLKQYEIKVPELDKSLTKTFLSTKKISGWEFPSGTRFEHGRIYEIEIANYVVPFSGDGEIFSCTPTSFVNGLIEAEVSRNTVTLQFTNYGTIAGNDEAIESMKQLFMKYVESIEENLTALKSDVEQNSPRQKLKFKSYLDEKIRKAKFKFDSGDKLNPFK